MKFNLVLLILTFTSSFVIQNTVERRGLLSIIDDVADAAKAAKAADEAAAAAKAADDAAAAAKAAQEAKAAEDAAAAKAAEEAKAAKGTDTAAAAPQSIQEIAAANNFELGKKLGNGQFGEVFQATEKTTGKTVAIKEAQAGGVAGLQNEIKIVNEFKGESNVIQSLGDFKSGDQQFLVLEFAAGGDSTALIGGSEAAIRRAIKEVATGLKNMRAKGFGHNDVKAENVLVMAPKDKIATFPADQELFKLADFGFTAPLKGTGNPDLTFFKRKLLPEWFQSFQKTDGGFFGSFFKSSGIPKDFEARLKTYTDFDQVLADPYVTGLSKT